MPKSTATARLPADTPFRPRPEVELCKRGERRCERFLDAATDVFIEKGYRQARLSDIVARAGGSMATLYRVFGDKEGLAHAIMERHMATVAEQLQALNLSGLPPQIALRQAGENMIDSVLTRESVLIHRIVIGEGRDFPGLRDWFFENAVAPAQAMLTDYLKHEIESGRLSLHSPQLASAQFFMMIFGELIIRVASGNLTAPDLSKAQDEARAALDLFLHGALPR
ncbi:TetR/AcrR family transcriptional regulator [Luteimonas aquatica]|uniref:TetR/AcrR family transcriptional regulator n=1 Tax=Luteimonas aquatica TaxID=450364 RepID=UPI001F58C179|nr:TetR/AcrR family transcriptional regulator [Luteimonas aquatica]